MAPDHPEVKNVINTFSKTAEHKNFRFLGNISLGSQVSLKDLQENYDAVVLVSAFKNPLIIFCNLLIYFFSDLWS